MNGLFLDFARQAKDNKQAIFFSVITECEVFSGLQSEYRLRGIKLFNSRRCLEVTSKIAQRAGDIRREQRAKGRKLKTPDADPLGSIKILSNTVIKSCVDFMTIFCYGLHFTVMPKNK